MILIAVSAAKAAAEPWMPQADFSITSKCATLMSDVQASESFGASSPETSFQRGGGWSLEAAAAEIANVYFCFWGGEVSPALGHVEAIFGGEWAFNQATQRSGAIDRTALSLTRLSEGATAWISCDFPESKKCTGDLITGGNWISVSVYPENPIDQKSAVTQVLQTIADNVG